MQRWALALIALLLAVAGAWALLTAPSSSPEPVASPPPEPMHEEIDESSRQALEDLLREAEASPEPEPPPPADAEEAKSS